jgi:GNAT superfamily N-acetyltransferase
MQFIKLTSKKQISSTELQLRAKAFPGRKIDLRYLVRRRAEDVGFLWYMAFPSERYLKVQEIYVLKEFRRQGIGVQMIQHAEELARRLKYDGLVLTPEPLDPEIDTGRLVAGYEKQGFVEADCGRRIYCKLLRFTRIR